MANAENMTFEAAAAKWLDAVKPRIKPTSCAQYTARLEKNILPYFKNTPLRDINADKLSELSERLCTEGLTPQYVYDILIQVKMITKYISRACGCPDPAIDAVFARPEPDVVKSSYDEINCGRLCEALTADPDLTKCGILMTLYTGLRIGELCALKWEDIDLDGGFLNISKTLQRVSVGENTGLVLTELKPCSSRKVPIAAFLQDILLKFKTDAEKFFLSGTTSPIEPRTMQYRLRAFLKKSYLPDISFSELRKLFIKRCLSRGADVTVLADVLGNASVQSAAAYCEKPTMRSKIEAVNLISKEVS